MDFVRSSGPWATTTRQALLYAASQQNAGSSLLQRRSDVVAASGTTTRTEPVDVLEQGGERLSPPPSPVSSPYAVARDSMRPAGDDASGSSKSGTGGSSMGNSELTPEQEQMVAELRARDSEVRAHENAHASVGGSYAGAPSYEFQVGPDGQQYAIGGEVRIDVSEVPGDPAATVDKMRVVRAAALAPAEPSAADLQVAATAIQKMMDAQREIARGGDASGESDSGNSDAKNTGATSDSADDSNASETSALSAAETLSRGIGARRYRDANDESSRFGGSRAPVQRGVTSGDAEFGIASTSPSTTMASELRRASGRRSYATQAVASAF